MPFVRFSRDRRGYEHTYLIHAAPRRGAPTRILYWYRTPPGIKVGREAFDVEARRMLEAQYPSVAFDWPKLLETPMPPPETENWRERRRVERSVRQARQLEEAEEAVVGPIEIPEPPRPEPIAAPPSDRGSVAGDPPEIDAGGTDTAGKKRRRRGGRRRRRPDGATESGHAAEQTSEADTAAEPGRSPASVETTAPETAAPPFSPSSGETADDMSTKAPD